MEEDYIQVVYSSVHSITKDENCDRVLDYAKKVFHFDNSRHREIVDSVIKTKVCCLHFPNYKVECCRTSNIN